MKRFWCLLGLLVFLAAVVFEVNEAAPEPKRHSVYQDSKFSQRLLAAFPNWLKPVHGQFWQSKMHHTLDFCPITDRKQSNVPKLKIKEQLRAYCPNIYTVPKGEKEVAVKVVAVAQAIILSSNTGILEIPGMDPILEILAMDQTTITTKIMVNINMSSFTYHMYNNVNLLHFRQNSNLKEIIAFCKIMSKFYHLVY